MKILARIALIALLAAASAASLAASLAERSPFAQGHWWDPSHPGSGFDMFNAGGQVVVNWYTYDPTGKPVWYTAQGPVGGLGSDWWPLLKHRWVAGSKAAPEQVGEVRLVVRNPESATLEWKIGAFNRSTSIVPFIVAGEMLEVDHTGSWFAPDNSGWGFALTQQGTVLGGVLFTYDASGDPVWASGFGRNPDASVDLFVFTGACPHCAYAPPSSVPVGRLAFDFTAEWQLTARAAALTLAMAPGVRVDAARMFQLSVPASGRPADRQLAAFDTAARLKTYLDAGMLNLGVGVSAGGGADFSAAPPSGGSAPYSTTNLQESGVDESDLVKFDGRLAYTFSHDAKGVREAIVRVAEVGPDGSTLQVRGSFPLTAPVPSVEAAGLYVAGNKVVSVVGTVPRTSGLRFGWAPTNSWANGTTQVELFDTSAASGGAPTSLWRATLDGHPVATRRIGDRLYVITRFVPSLPGFAFGAGRTAINDTILATTPLAQMTPKIRVNGAAAADLVPIDAIHAPPLGTTRPYADMIVLTSIDLANARVAQTLAVLGAVEALYMSPTNLYVATSRLDLARTPGSDVRINPSSFQSTDVHEIALAPTGMSVVGSGTIEGILGSNLDKAAFRLSEDRGRLRVVTSATVDMGWGTVGNRNRVSILEPSRAAPGVLRTVSVLPNAKRPQVLGLPLEELYGTRFVGDKLYAVTFTSARFAGQVPSVDPLFVVDLSNPADPSIRGELVIPGFSDYLHPLGNGLLLGFGRSVTMSGVVQGLQLSLFDVSDDARPRAIQQVTIGKRGSDSALLQTHHAFSSVTAADGTVLLGFPARVHDGAAAGGSDEFTTYAWQQSGLQRYAVQGTTPATARLVQMPALTTAKLPAAAPAPDGATANARSILMPGATIYVANGKFWRQDDAGGVSGPF